MIPMKGVVRVLALATNEGKNMDICTGMSCRGSGEVRERSMVSGGAAPGRGVDGGGGSSPAS